MIISLLTFLAAAPLQAPTPAPVPAYVVSILHENVGADSVVRFVLSSPPSSYSATRESEEIVVRIAAEPLTGLSLPSAREPIRALAFGAEPGFNVRLTVPTSWSHEIVREVSSLRLVLKERPPTPVPTPEIPNPQLAVPAPTPDASPSPEAPASRVEARAVDTADLYRRLFPTTAEPVEFGAGMAEVGNAENWYSNFRWLGLQLRPWVSLSYVDGKTIQPETNTVSADSYLVIQPNLGLGFSPRIGGDDGASGQWRINYTPRFRRLADLNLPKLTSHFFDVGLDQPIASLGTVRGTYHISKGVLETEEVDPGREYGIGLNRVIDTSLERFRRTTLEFGARINFVAETEIDVNATETRVRYGNDPEDATSGPRAFFDYDTRTLNASLRRGLGSSRFISLLFAVHDTPTQAERKQVEGRGYSYGAALEGEIAALTTGRLQFGYRTQKNPNAGEGGREYKDVTYAAQLVRELRDDVSVGLGADRRLYLSAYEDNGFYVADSVKADLNARFLFGAYLRGTFGLQSNDYETSPQTNDGSTLILRNDKIRYWSVGLARTFREWAFLRVDYTSERRNSNLNRFDIKSRALTVQLGLGFFGKAGGNRAPATW